MDTHLELREVLRCHKCTLNQFRTRLGECRRCHEPYPEPVIEIQLESELPAALKSPRHGLRIADRVRAMRRARGLSQRALAERMGVPRTYISKLENEKAIPTLRSCERIAIALRIEIWRLFPGEIDCHVEKLRRVLQDPWLMEIAGYLPSVSAKNLLIVENTARMMKDGRHNLAAFLSI